MWKIKEAYMIKIVLAGLVALIIATGLGCSRGASPVTPSEPQQPQDVSVQTNPPVHHLWYYNMVSIDPATLEIETIPLRNVADHWNVLKWLEQGPCTNCVSITGAQKLINNNLLVSVQIKHPFASFNFTGFDVRGIAMFKGTQTFPVAGLKTSSILKNEGELVNADGFTSLYNSTTLGSGPGGLQGYLQGKLGAGVPDSTINGYKTYITNDGFNLRNYFTGGTTLASNFEIHMPPLPFILGYAVDASWAPPTVKPVVNPNTDFPPEANCPEPWKVVVTEDPADNSLTNLGGTTTLTIDVYDWQGKDSYKTPTVECPDLFNGYTDAHWVEDSADYTRWEVDVSNLKNAAAGKYKALVAVEDNDNDTSPAYLDLTAYRTTTLLVTSDTTFDGWAVTFGGDDWDHAFSSIADSLGNVYATGLFAGDCNFDPDGSQIKTSNGGKDAFLAKYDADGNFEWVNAWGGTNWEMGINVALNGANVLCYGYYEGTVDFSGGAGTDVRESNGNMDYFLSAYDAASGVHKWTATWGSSNYDYANGLGVDALGNIYMGGTFGQPCDFDPGSGVHEVDPIGYDAFLLKFSSNGAFKWVKTWGADTGEDMKVTTIATTQSGDTWMCGYFWDMADFDPGPGIDNHVSSGQADCWVSRFDSNGNFLWARTFGNATSEDYAMGVVPDFLGNCYITGQFRNTVDFDPGAGVQEFTSYGLLDAFLLELDSNGNYVWCGIMGGTFDDLGRGVSIDPLGNILIVGEFEGNANVSPTITPSNRMSNGSSDIFLTKISPSYDFLWADTWGGTGQEHLSLMNYFEYGNPVSVDIYGKAYVTGQFADVVNFNPNNGDPADDHTASGSFDAFITTIPPSGNW